MSHPSESQLVAFLGGLSTADDAARIDDHLIACESCWQKVRQDRLGRQLAESLRTEPSPTLRDRVRLAVELAEPSRPGQSTRQRPKRRGIAAVAVTALALTGAIAGTILSSSGSRLSAVTAVAKTAKALPNPPAAVTPVSSRPVRIGSLPAPSATQPLQLVSYRYANVPVIVAVSPRQFPMPHGAVGSAGNSVMTWSATVDGVHLYCINGAEPTLIAGRLPTAKLAEIALDVLKG